jgi:hypothetical protein
MLPLRRRCRSIAQPRIAPQPRGAQRSQSTFTQRRDPVSDLFGESKFAAIERPGVARWTYWRLSRPFAEELQE